MVDVPGNASTTVNVTVGSTTNGALELIGDHDWYRIALTAGQSVSISLNGLTVTDPYLYIRDSSGNILFENDDIADGNLNSELAFKATYSGAYYIDASAWNDEESGTYQLTVQSYTPPTIATNDQIANQLVYGYWGGDSHHFNVSQGGTITVNITALTTAGKTLARAALAQWSDIIGVKFQEVATGGQITFDDNEDGAFTDANWSGGLTSTAHVNVSTQWLADYGTTLDSYSFQSYVHEIGHALGLGHAGNYNETASYPYDAQFENDAWSTSVMSYFSQRENTYFAGLGFSEDYVVTPMVADILAMETLYGLSTATRTGNTTYGFNSNAGRDVFNARLYPDVAYTVYDSGGVDTLDFSGFRDNQRIDLNAESFSNVGGQIGNLAIARGVTIENAVGGSGNDELLGNAYNNVLDGGAGGDTMKGGAGNDSYYVGNTYDKVYENSSAGADIVYSTMSYRLGANVEKLTLTGTASINATGNSLNNVLVGNSGANNLDGAAGADTMSGGAGNDTYHVGNRFDQVIENAAAGADTVFSTISYTLSANVETLRLQGSAAIDASGNGLDNVLAGNSGANTLSGGAGNDKLLGGKGTDQLWGGSGADEFAFGSADFGGLAASTADRIHDFSQAEGDHINLNQVDANSLVTGRQHFSFIGEDDFHNVAGELRYEESGGNTYVTGDTNGDGVADFLILLDGTHNLTGSDFLL
ncbi:M10 family metallopeptidase C-terminal domain-containing protein [Sphingomonas telluris]|uniref:M10 family metallopeptidase C-terminal domain-containing protein n=1 Tax=Sphingomonas telluris TaxID=2907998 RepID=UPI002409B082|nr:M10 family metallopeptidase C-terminal domain-containing protein [Sphingomonas telluris]